jgi:hypothetical protein
MQVVGRLVLERGMSRSTAAFWLMREGRKSMSVRHSEQMNYEQIKQVARQTGRRVADLIVLAPQNDPFYTGTPNDWALGEWFAGLWHAFGYDKAHLRRVHYQIISQRPPVVLPNGKPYENTVECWDILNLASKAARYLGLIDPQAFHDRRTPEVMVFAEQQNSEPHLRVYGVLYRSDTRLPDFPELPTYSVGGYVAEQPYHLEVWCEKSTMNDVLAPLCQRFGANLQTGMGEMSITATLALIHRLQQMQKPARIFYVSDFDPAGQSMPVAVARKIEYFVRTSRLNLDIRLFPVVLTLEQVRAYQLPRTPIKETERRRVGFEERYGEGAVELDALEALYPGQLQVLLSQYLASYYDATLAERVRAVEAEVEAAASAVWQAVIDSYTDEIEALKADYEQIRQAFAAQMQGYGARLQGVWQAIRHDLFTSAPSLEQYPVPMAEGLMELGEGLYNSERDYLEQLEVYKLFQGKEGGV